MKIIAITILVAAMLLSITEARYASLNINLALTVSEDSHQLSKDMVRICTQETDISMDELNKFRNNDFTNSSKATQCFAQCIYEQMGIMRDGVFVERDMIKTLSDITDPNVMLHKECLGIKGLNKCETAYKIYQCHHEQRMRELETAPPPPPPPAAPTVNTITGTESATATKV